MRLAVVVAPSDPRAGDAVSRRESLAWLRGQLVRHGFDVVIVGGGQDPATALDRAAERISPGDAVLVHVGGRLTDPGTLAFGAGRSIGLGALAKALSSRGATEIGFLAELMHSEDPDDGSLASAWLATAVGELSGEANRKAHDERDREATAATTTNGTAATRGVLACLRPLATQVTRLAFTQRALPKATASSHATTVAALLSSIHAVALSDAALSDVAQCLVHVPKDAAARTRTPPPAPPARVPELLPPPVPLRSSAPPRPEGRPLDTALASAIQRRDWERVVEVRRARVDGASEPSARVNELIALAQLQRAELDDPGGAVATLEQALAIEPERPTLLRALRLGYESLGRWASAVEVTGTLATLSTASTERAGLRVAQAQMALARLGDEGRAAIWLREAIEADPNHQEALAAMRALQEHLASGGVSKPEDEASTNGSPAGGDGGALEDLEAIAVRDPFHAQSYAARYALALSEGNTDGALLAAMSLDALGSADPSQQAHVHRCRSVAPVRARAALDPAAWEALRAPGHDDVLAAVFVAVESAAIALRLEETRDPRRGAALDREQRLSETSTASVVRSFQWASRFLGVPCPDLYVRDEVHGVAVLHASETSVGLGPAVLSGPSAKDLAFLAGRQLTQLRPEYRVLSYYPTREDLTMLLFAAAQLGTVSNDAAADASGSVRSLRVRLSRHLGQRERAALTAAVTRLDARGGLATIGAWMRSLELTSARAGLLLCGDLATALALIASDLCPSRDVATEVRRGDLLAFCASQTHATLRARFVALSDSVAPSQAPRPQDEQREPGAATTS